MKYLLRWSTLMLTLILMCSTMQAHDLTPNITPTKMLVKLYSSKANVLTFQLANLEQKSTLVTIQSIEGASIFRQKITNHNGFLLDINLSEIPEGRYIMRVRQANGQRTAQVILKSEGQLMLSQLTRIK